VTWDRSAWQCATVNLAFRDGQFVDVYLMARLREQKG
jgi:hypothetical protein